MVAPYGVRISDRASAGAREPSCERNAQNTFDLSLTGLAHDDDLTGAPNRDRRSAQTVANHASRLRRVMTAAARAATTQNPRTTSEVQGPSVWRGSGSVVRLKAEVGR